MGGVFAEEIVGLRAPTVALLSIGEEPEKGNKLVREAHAELATDADLHFVGNVEGRDLLRKAADVVVCDGFTGNMALKLLEGTIQTTLQAFRDELTDSTRGKLGGLLIRPAARASLSAMASALSVLGLVFGISKTAVTPPSTAARLPLSRSSFASRPGSRKWT